MCHIIMKFPENGTLDSRRGKMMEYHKHISAENIRKEGLDNVDISSVR